MSAYSPIHYYYTGNTFGVSESISGALDGENTSITVNGTTYSSVGGLKGSFGGLVISSHGLSGSPLSAALGAAAVSAASSTNNFSASNDELVSARPNISGYDRLVVGTVSVTCASPGDGTFHGVESRVFLASQGLSAPTEKYEISVTPGTSITYSVGKSGGFGSTGGALYITY
jgi:hypothetical protein